MQNKSQKLHNILLEIVRKKRQDLVLSHPEFISGSNKKKMLNQVQHDVLFKTALLKRDNTTLIGEIKLASPINPSLGSKKQLLQRAKLYEKSGIDAISIITEQHYFKGDISFVSQVKKQIALPILQKDFIIDEYQIYQAKNIGSDALLLIARLVGEKKLQEFVFLCKKLGIEPVVEINDEEDLKKAIASNTKIIAVNARNLETFAVDVKAACRLLKKVPDQFIKLGFSGIISAKEVLQYKKAGVRGILIGTSLMKANNVKKFIMSLKSIRKAQNRDDESVKVKICGVRDLKSAQASIEAGADFLGFNFVKTSRHFINPVKAKKIIYELGIMNQELQIKFVGVFQNNPFTEVNKIAKDLGLDYVQLHGEEDKQYLNKITYPIIKKLNDGKKPILHPSDFMLLDRKVQGQGEMIDLEKAKELAKQYKIFFSGGLTPESVSNITLKVKPFAVDVAGGIETDGKQDLKKIKEFITNAKEVVL